MQEHLDKITYKNLSLKEILTKRNNCNNPEKPLNRISLQNLVGMKDLVGAEIGVSSGDNAFDILMKLDIAKLFLIDPYTTRQGNVKHKRIADELLYWHQYKLIWFATKSEWAARFIEDEELDFVYIDGDHSQRGALKDIQLYWPKVKKGGLVAGDNYEAGAIQKAIKQSTEINDNKLFTADNIDTTSIDWWIIKE